MSKDRYERRHRKTHRNADCVEAMSNADFDAVPPLAEAMGLTPPAGLTCVHAEQGLCPQCQADYDQDPEGYLEMGDHPAGLANYQQLLNEMAEEQARVRDAADQAALFGFSDFDERRVPF